nr:hypothetical protein [Tanacetum cinerariifolium]
MGEEFKAYELSCTRTVSSHSLVSSDSTTPLSPDHPLTHVSPSPTPTRILFHHRTARMAMRTHPTLSTGMLARIAKVAALSPSSFRKRYISSYETPSSLTLPVPKRYRGTSELIEDTEGEILEPDSKRKESEDESLDSNDERESHDLDDESYGLDYKSHGLDDEGQGLGDESHGLDDEGQGLDYEGQGLEDGGLGMEEEEEVAPEGQQAVPIFDPEDGRVYTDISTYAPPAAPVQTPPSPKWSLAFRCATTYLFEGYDGDLKELYTRSGEVRNEIFSQRYRFRSLEREQKRATVTFSAIWRLVLALEAWAGQTGA